MATARLALHKKTARFFIIIMTLLFAVSLASLAAAQYEDLEDLDFESDLLSIVEDRTVLS